jgi:hypothetical protein
MQKLPDNGLSYAGQLRRLERISAGIDGRVCTAVELGIKERLYFQRVIVPAIENDNGDLVRGPRREWLPVTGPVQTELLAILRHELRPVPVQHKPPKEAAQNRLDFGAAIVHRPGDPGPSLSA